MENRRRGCRPSLVILILAVVGLLRYCSSAREPIIVEEQKGTDIYFNYETEEWMQDLMQKYDITGLPNKGNGAGEKESKQSTKSPERSNWDRMSEESKKAVRKYADKIIDEIITKNMTEVEKVKQVHDYIVLNTAYDYENLQAGTLPESSYTIEGVLWEKLAVCQGYAETFQLFMDILKIESKLVIGMDLESNVGHAWNMVKLDGDWYHIDTTWDDPVPDQKGMIHYNYFLAADEVISENHSWKREDYPAAKGTKYRYYVYKDRMISSIREYENMFMKCYDAGERVITILYPEKSLPDMNFMEQYERLFKQKDGKLYLNYSWYPAWRLGDYTVLTVIIEQ